MNAKMPELKRCFEAAGFTNVVTVISSGNVVFDSRSSSVSSLEKKIEKAMEEHLERSFVTFVRSIEDLTGIIESDPFGEFDLDSTVKPIITFMRNSSDTKLKLPLNIASGAILKVYSREVYSVYKPSVKNPNFMGVLEKNFGKVNTTRTLETVKRVIKK